MYNVFENVNKFNPVAAADSYKYSHPFIMSVDVEGMTAYIEPRVKGKTVVLFGLQAWIKKYLMVDIEQWMIDEVEHDLTMHGLPFDKKLWQSIVDGNKRLPITIRAIPEGMPVPSGNALITVTAGNGINGEHFSTLVGWVETSLQRAVWYGSTIASEGYERRKKFEEIWKNAGADLSGLDFAYHDFAGRGVTCNEQAENGGMAHLLNFRGTDTFECLRAIRRWYPDGTNPAVSGFSVWAGEHNIALSFGTTDEAENAYLDHMIEVAMNDDRCKILSFVVDTIDWQKCVERFCERKDAVVQLSRAGKRIVLRPDSDDMQITVPWIINKLIDTFGFTTNSKGLKIPAMVGVIQGDGVDTLSAVCLQHKLISMGICPSSIVFGSGGALLQKVSRDDMSFAMKGSAFHIDGEWQGRQKLTPGKKSKIGILHMAKMTDGTIKTINRLEAGEMAQVAEILDREVYKNGVLLVDDSFETIRSRLV